MSSAQIGHLLQKRYRLDDVLGEGGMGLVYRGYDTFLERPVAVKLVSEVKLGTKGRARLLREAKATAQLNHPNIVSVYDAGEIDKSPFIIMELVDGVTLHESRPAELETIVEIARQICAALQHAHDHEIIHRDLKPENVMMLEDGTIKLMDFGLARSVASRLSAEGSISGTVFYMAPEIARGQAFDGRADLYSLGVMLYELTTGELPFYDRDPLAVISQHLHAPVVPARARREDVPPRFDVLLSSLLAKVPEDRPDSAAEVSSILKAPDILALESADHKEIVALERMVRGRMVGRKVEQDELRQRWQEAISGRGSLILVSGEPGIGKTRLMRQLATEVQITEGQAFQGAAYAEGGLPYDAFRQIMRASFPAFDDSQNGLNASARADLARLVPEIQSPGQSLDHDNLLNQASDQQRLFEHVVSFVRTLSDHRPTLWVLDDVHWADSGTLFLMRHLARRTRDQRFLLVATYRELELDEARPFNEVLLDINREQLALRIKLTRLDFDKTGDLLKSMFDDPVSDNLVDAIYQETEGNPFFIEEVSKSLVESGDIYFAEGAWHAKDLNTIEVPQGVKVAIQSRVNRLPEATRSALNMASILGREFKFDTLVAALDIQEEVLIEALENAERAQLVAEVDGAPDVAFAFVHALIPTTLVDSIRTLRRRKMHGRAAAAITSTHPDELEALAYHFGEAGDDEEALIYYVRAGERAASAYANAEAEEYYQSALDLSDQNAAKVNILVELGKAEDALGKHREAARHWGEAIEIFKGLDEADSVAECYAFSARAIWLAGDSQAALALCMEGVEAVEGAPPGPGMARLLTETSRNAAFMSRMEDARAYGLLALEMTERVNAPDVQADALINLGTFNEDPDEGVEFLLRAIELAEAERLWNEAARAHNNVAPRLAWHHGRIDEAAEHLAVAAELASRIGNRSQELFFRSAELNWRLLQGSFKEIDTGLPALQTLADELADPGPAGHMLHLVEAANLRFKGDFEPAFKILWDVHAQALTGEDHQMLVSASNLLAEMHIEQKQWPEAEPYVRSSIELVDRGTLMSSVLPRVALIAIQCGRGELEAARKTLAEARAHLATGKPRPEMAWLAVGEARLLDQEGLSDKSSVAYEEALLLVRRTGFLWYLARIQQEYGEHLLGAKSSKLRARGAAVLEEAADTYRTMGSDWYSEVLAKQLKSYQDDERIVLKDEESG